MIKKTILLLIVFYLFCGSSVNAQNITLGYVNFPPYEYEDNGKASGVLVTIVESVFQRADIPLSLEYLPFKRAYESVINGEIDGLFNFYKIEERLNFFDYSEPIIENPLVFFVLKDSTIEFNKLEDLSGLNIAVMRGYTYGVDFDENTSFSREVEESHISNFKKLKSGRVDAYPCDKLVGIHVAMVNNIMSDLKILPVTLKVMDGYIGFTKGKHQETISIINNIITEMHQNGEIAEIIDQYLEDNKQ